MNAKMQMKGNIGKLTMQQAWSIY